MEKESAGGGRSLAETPTWAVASVIGVMVCFGYIFHLSLKMFGKWLGTTKSKSLLSALEKIHDELMLFGVLSLLMGHWIEFVAKICVKQSALSSRFMPCASKDGLTVRIGEVSTSEYLNYTVSREQETTWERNYCPEGQESFASYECLEQLHRFIFVLGITHVFYSFAAIALALVKIYSWRAWENQAKTMATRNAQDSHQAGAHNLEMKRLSTFVFRHVSHPWSQHRVLVWLLCFSRQFWSSINRADYMALRHGFITTHQLPLTYDFHNYMLRSMEEEFCDIVGISVPLWIYGILCIILDFHGSDLYFCLSFLPAMLILLIGMKLHRVVIMLASEVVDNSPWMQQHKFHLRDELFWFRRPRLVLRLIQFISFQNAYEMASFIWSLWEIKDSTCFMENSIFMIIRLTFGVISQCWCSFLTFPLYVIIAEVFRFFNSSCSALHLCLSDTGFVVIDGFKVQKVCCFRKCQNISIPVDKNGKGKAEFL
ncbi:hypothetical protein SLEP1_g51314 [Rubroshorea leprosula]|uniref:MLO-like protein n=2 Tax=Rubroshorea leprosula TaxID=152421 RepID=A0AAV5M588_9ROSI|nr:hypothetical protein SLEP1_g51314 [Rubroshorea leprosula]